MPQALPAIGAFVVKVFTAKTLAFAIIRTVLINLALGAISKKLAKRREGSPPINVTIRGTVESRRIILGTRRAGGVMVFYGVSSTGFGSSTNDLLWYVIVYAGHQVSAIGDVYIDTRRVESANINPTTGVVSGNGFSDQLWIWKHLGTGAQTVDTNIDSAFSAWTSDHRLRGCAYLVVKMRRDNDLFPSGAPNSVSAVIDGALCYDPREGGHDPDDPSTWEFTRNPALHARWYLTGGSVVNDQSTRMVMYGLREPNARIDDAYTIAAANICDEVLSGANAPPSGSQIRYRCDIEASCGESRRDIVNAILQTMAGTATKQGGMWRIFAGAYDSPSHTLTQDDLCGPLEVQDTDGHQERYNAVSAVYVDAAKQWVEQTTPYRTDSAYETQDGGERITRELDLRAVTVFEQAQRLSEIELRKSRMMRTVKLVGALNLMKVAKNETFTQTHPPYNWTNRVFRCLERQFEFNEEAGKVAITARREDAGVYTDMLTGDYVTGTSETDVFTSDAPAPLEGLTATGLRNRIGFQWQFATRPGDRLGSTVELWEYTASTPFSSATKIWEGEALSVEIRKADYTTRYYWVRYRAPNGQVSAEYPVGGGVAGTATSVGFDTTVLLQDPEFQYGETWWARNADAAAGVTFSTTGGLLSGVVQIVADGTSKRIYPVYPHQTTGDPSTPQQKPVVNGTVVICKARWRRTSASATGSLPQITFQVGARGKSAATNIAVDGSHSVDVTSVTQNVWQEVIFTTTIASANPNFGGANPPLYLYLAFGVQSTMATGTVEVDYFDAHFANT